MTIINSDDLEAPVRDLVEIQSENPQGDEGEVASFLAEQLADTPRASMSR